MLKSLACLAFVATLLVGCGPPQPTYETRYEQVEPRTPQGRYCATSCVSARQTCTQNCSIISGQCTISHKQQAQNEYQNYVRERAELGRPLKKIPSDFEYGILGSDISGCGSSKGSCEQQCFQNFSQCHTSCGGQVIPHTVCVGNCNAPPAQAW